MNENDDFARLGELESIAKNHNEEKSRKKDKKRESILLSDIAKAKAREKMIPAKKKPTAKKKVVRKKVVAKKK